MLALPISTGLTGYLPSIITLFICWIYMTYTAFLFLEVNMWMGEGVNIVSMAEFTLGIIGKIVGWIVYLFLLYALTTAYLSGCSAIFVNSIFKATGTHLPWWFGPIPFVILFGICVYLGTRPVDYFNRILMIGLVVTYVILGIFISPHIEVENLSGIHMGYLWPSIAVVVTSFGFHIIIPSLSHYLHYDLKHLKLTLLIGSIIPFLVYFFWETFVLGTIPLHGKEGLLAMRKLTHPELGIIHSLRVLLSSPMLALAARLFSYFAILTSFIGVSLSLSDFLADGLKIKKTAFGRLLTCILTFIPPLIISLTYPHVFLSALKYAGVFVAILLGILPAAMVWSGRYRMKLVSDYRVPGGRVTLIIIILLSLSVIVIDFADKRHLFPAHQVAIESASN